MKDSIHRYFQMGTLQWMSFPPARYPLLDSFRKLCADDFFDAIEVTHIADPEVRKQVIALLKQAHMRVCYGAQPRLLGAGLNPNAIDEAERKKAEDVLIDSIDDAEEMGARGIAFLAGTWEEETKEEAFRQLVKTTRRICEYAAKKHMFVELEVFDYDMAKKSLIGPAPLALRFAEAMRTCCSNFGLLVDLSHIPTTYETSRFVIQTLRPYITHLHIGNAVVKPGCPAYGDEHPRFGFPDSANDTAELADFFCVLRDEGFFREHDPMVLSFEVKPWGEEDGDVILANTKRVVNRAWALVEEKS